MLVYYSQTVSAMATATCDLRAAALLLYEAITGTPAGPRALSFLFEIVINNAARVAGHGKVLFSSVGEATGILK